MCWIFSFLRGKRNEDIGRIITEFKKELIKMSDNLTTQVSALTDQVNKLVNDARAAQARVAAAQAAMQDQITKLTAEVQALPVDTSAAEAQIAALTKTLAEVDAGITAFDPVATPTPVAPTDPVTPPAAS